MILETPWAPNPKIYTWNPSGTIHDPLALSVTPRVIEDMLVNATLSTLSMGNWTTTASVTVEDWTNYYRFSNMNSVFLPYGIALAISLVLVNVGLAALVKNGVAAETGGFLQAACTTAGGGNIALEQMLASGCLGGAENMASVDGDSGIEFLYGELLVAPGDKAGQGDAQGEDLVKRAGFGPVGEVGRLKKGTIYGVYHQ